MVPTTYNNIINEYYYYYNAVCDSESDKEVKENFFDKIDDEIEVTSRTTLYPKAVQAIKNFQALYNKEANRVVEQAA